MIDVPSSSGTTRHSSSELDSALAALSVDFDAFWRCQDEVRTVVKSSCKRDHLPACFSHYFTF